MDKKEYESLHELEDEYWWHRALRNIIETDLLKSNESNEPLSFLDAGCGTGGTMKLLEGYGKVVGIDRSEVALHYASQLEFPSLAQGSVSYLPLQDNSFDFVISLDVLYHMEVNDEVEALKEFFRVLKPRGHLILHLPAFEKLRGSHDEIVHTRRRYTRDEVEALVTKAGFNVKRIGYRNFVTLPLLFLNRVSGNIKARFGIGSAASDMTTLPLPLNQLLFGLTKLENFTFGKKGLPIGSSIYCSAVKGDSADIDDPSVTTLCIDALAKQPVMFDAIRWVLEAGFHGHHPILNKMRAQQDAKVLDIGCGTGIFSPFFETSSYTGIDIDEKYIDRAKAKYPEHSFQEMDATKLQFDPSIFDICFISGIIHHLDDSSASKVISEARRVLKTNGCIVVWEDIPTQSSWNIVGRTIHSLDKGDFIRQPGDYRQLIEAEFDIEQSRLMRSGFMDYVVFFGRPKSTDPK